ncbi:hypothetical protein M0654_14105 [Rhizobium sp. NTR19]|uniref:Uncharacterized protein n=1 Tax=Neorhizobium turbinariae TaxID=2937795 RepID=A0ABT0ITB2_9HYPH|nr:hypothetical protein [Neorhizobium turbinariae]MCK8781116.1 hypothetical protein [Neorhizobium turbinariae]
MSIDRIGTKGRCVFCGEKLFKKNEEHVIPKWAMRETGTTGTARPFYAKLHSSRGYIRVHEPWRKLTVPAHQSCNSEFSQLENLARTALLAIQSGDEVTPRQLGQFADWIDKVRVGFWWWVVSRSGNPLNVPMTFGIADRLGTKDRLIRVSLLDCTTEGLNILGASSLGFQNQPSAFALRFNNVLVLSVSSDFILAERMGYAYPTHWNHSSDGLIEIELAEGRGAPRIPIFPRLFGIPGTAAYQTLSGPDKSPLMVVDNEQVKPFPTSRFGSRWQNISVSGACALLEMEVRAYQWLLLQQSAAQGAKISPVFRDLVLTEHNKTISAISRAYFDRALPVLR